MRYREGLTDYVNNQLRFFGGENDVTQYDVEEALKKSEPCFKNSPNKYFYDGEELVFNETNSIQYTIFLWNLSKHFSVNQKTDIADKVYYLNKMLNCVDWYHGIDLPEVWGIEHPLGSILGRAKYSSGLFLYQGTTVGGSNDCYPTLGKNVLLYSNSSILGNCNIGNNVIISSGVKILDKDIPDNSLVFSKNDEIVIVRKDKQYIKQKMSNIWKDAMFD